MLEVNDLSFSAGCRKDEFIIRAWFILDELWFRRNKLALEGIEVVFDKSLAKIRVAVKEHLRRVDEVALVKPCGVVRTGTEWRVPEAGVIKINCDASFKKDIATVGPIAKHSGGGVVWMWRSKVSAALAIEAELKGYLHALLVAKFRGVSEVIVEGDNRLLLDCLKFSRPCPIWFLEVYFQNILLLFPFFSRASFNWVRRESNSAAHALCQWAARDAGSGFCSLGNAPIRVRSAFADDDAFAMLVPSPSAPPSPPLERR